MNKPVWTWTHTGEQGEELAECEGKYYTRHAWDHFLAAYTGKVRRVGRDRPGFGSRVYPPDHTGYNNLDFHGGIDFFSDGQDLWPADETTDPMPQPVIRPGKLIASFPLKKKDKP